MNSVLQKCAENSLNAQCCSRHCEEAQKGGSDPVLTSVHSVSSSLGKKQIHECKANPYSHRTIVHATSSPHHSFTECLPCARPRAKHGREKRKKAHFLSSGRSEPTCFRNSMARDWEPEKSFWKVLKRTVKINTWQCFLSRDQDPKSQVGCNHRQLSDSLPTIELMAMQAALGLQGQWAFLPPFLPAPGPPMRIPSCMRFVWREDTAPLPSITSLPVQALPPWRSLAEEVTSKGYQPGYA